MTAPSNLTNGTLIEEIEAINAIFGPSTLASSLSTLASSTPDPILILALPSQPFSFRLSFPPTYPSQSPSILGTETTHGSTTGDGRWAVGVLRSTLEGVWKPDSVCLFDLIEEATGALERGRGVDGINPPEKDNMGECADANDRSSSPDTSHIPEPGPQWTLSAPTVEKKSLFLARCAPATSTSHATASISHLLRTNKKVSTATHNITAWRLRNPNPAGSAIQDCDDDGETAAGGRLLHLLQLMDCWDVVVVVTRWYGGVKLGPDRFRIINAVAREALMKGGFAKEKEDGHVKKKGKKG